MSLGEVAEWLKALLSKSSVQATVPRVRIPPSPPKNIFVGMRVLVYGKR
jgi:hypothetical protein